MKLAVAPLLFAGCAHQSPPPVDPSRITTGRNLSVESTPQRSVSIDAYTVTAEELAASMSSSAVMARILSQQQAKLKSPPAGKQNKRSAKAQADASVPESSGKRRRSKHVFASNKASPDLATPTAFDQLPGATPCEQETVKPSRGKHGRHKSEPSSTCVVALDAPGNRADSRSGQKTALNSTKPGKSDDSWDTVRGGMRLAGVQHENLDAQMEHLKQHPGIVTFLMNRAAPYLQYLTSEINRQGLPNDLILVPMVESAFQTTAVSPKQAAGLWQFIPSTGQRFGLQVTDTYDGRFDTHPATQAALKYLKYLNKLFQGDWLLTFAAYNAGEGAVQRAINANKQAGGGGTFWELDLPVETEAYVVKILSLAKVIANPGEYGLKSAAHGGRATLTRVEAGPEVKIVDLIAASGIAADEFYRLNPAYKPDVVPPPQRHDYLLPMVNAETLMAANLPETTVHASPPRKAAAKKGTKSIQS